MTLHHHYGDMINFIIINPLDFYGKNLWSWVNCFHKISVDQWHLDTHGIMAFVEAILHLKKLIYISKYKNYRCIHSYELKLFVNIYQILCYLLQLIGHLEHDDLIET